MTTHADANIRPPFDTEMAAIADYLCDGGQPSEEALETARYSLLDSLGCAMLALDFPECTRLLGPLVPGTSVPLGSRVPGTPFELDPVQAAFNIGLLVRWLDFNDTWLAAEWGHPSDNFAGILSLADHLSRKRRAAGEPPLLMREVLVAAVAAYEIQGVMALSNSFNRVGLDHVVLVKLASAAVAVRLLGGARDRILDVLSQVWVDGQSLRTYRHAPNTGSRKSWAAGDAAARGVRLALLTMTGEQGYPGALSAAVWGFYDASFRERRFSQERPYGSYVMENILFKVSYPAEFHGQTAVECAVKLHPEVAGRLEEIERIVITTQESALRIISKKGPLHNPPDRDHCIQYMVAAALVFGSLSADMYADRVAADPRLDLLRGKMEVVEDPRYSREYLEPDKRSIANAVEVFFRDGGSTGKVEVEYPLGHRRRRAEGIPLLLDKCRSNLRRRLSEAQVERILALCLDRSRLERTPVDSFLELLLPAGG